jgi:hypothetical protein
MTGADGYVLEVVKSAWVSVQGMASERNRGGGAHGGEETGIHGKRGRGPISRALMFVENVTQVLRLLMEIVRDRRSRVMCMPRMWVSSPRSLVLKRLPSVDLN